MADPTTIPDPAAVGAVVGPAAGALFEGADPRCPRCGVHLLGASDPVCGRCGVDPRSPEARARHARVGGRFHELLRGASYVPAALATVVRHPALLGTLALPALLNLLIALGITYLVMPSLVDWLRYLTMPDMMTDWTGWLTLPRYSFMFLGWSLRVAGVVVVPGLAAWLLCAPPFRFIFAATGAMISGSVERRVLGLPLERSQVELLQREKAIASSVLSSVGLMLLETAAYVLLMPLALVPAAGTFVWVMGPRAVFAGFEALDPVLCRKVYSPGEKVALLRLRRFRFLGLGTTVLLLLCLPLVNTVVFPLASVAATLLYLDLDRK